MVEIVDKNYDINTEHRKHPERHGDKNQSGENFDKRILPGNLCLAMSALSFLYEKAYDRNQFVPGKSF